MKSDVLILALALDLAFGDPPNRWHPTAWMGSLIAASKRQALKRTRGGERPPPGAASYPATELATSPAGDATAAPAAERATSPAGSPAAELATSPSGDATAAPAAFPAGSPAAERATSPAGSPPVELALGAGIALGGMGLAAGVGVLLIRLCAALPAPLGLLAEAALLKTTFSLRGLDRAAGEVQAALERDDLPEARRALAWHLVSRETAALDEALVAAATVESVAENTADSLLAPLCYYALGGLPAALAYRFANTADAMLGYHTPELEWLGKVPARLDDLLNLLPARLAGLCIALAAPLAGGSLRGALRTMRHDARRTQSPNAGYPMSAMAGALGVELEKRGHYRLGAGMRAATEADIRGARQVMLAAALLFACAALAAGRLRK